MSRQLVFMREGAWRVGKPLLSVARHEPAGRPHHVRHQRNEDVERRLERPVVAPAPQPHVDKFAKFDNQQARSKPANRTSPQMERELNRVAFEGDGPFGARPDRANVGYAAVKARFRR